MSGPRGTGQCSFWHHHPHSALVTSSLAVPRSGTEPDPERQWGSSPFLATRRRDGPQPSSDHSVPDRGKAMPRRLKTQSLCDLEQNPSPLWALLVPCPFSQPKLPRDPSSEGLEAAQAPVLVLRPMWPSQDTAVLQVVLAFSQTKQFPVVIPEPVWGFCRRESLGGRFFQFSNITWWSCS